jgi:hypothetical protein
VFLARRDNRELADLRTIFRCIARSESCCETADKLLDAGQDGLLIAREGPVIGAVEFDESRLRDVAGEMPAGADANGAIAKTLRQGREVALGRRSDLGPAGDCG